MRARKFNVPRIMLHFARKHTKVLERRCVPSTWTLLLPLMSKSNVRFRYLTKSGQYSASPVMAVPIPNLPEIERLSPRVVRVLGGNPSKVDDSQ